MATILSQVFRSVDQSSSVVNRHLPMLNVLHSSLRDYYGNKGQLNKKKALMKWVKGIPELTGFVNKLARDMVQKYHFEPVTETQTGRNKLLAANKFAAEVELTMLMYSQVVDMLGVGEGFGWKGKITKSQIKEVVNNVFKKYKGKFPQEMKEFKESLLLENKQTNKLDNVEGISEDILAPRKYRHVASTTMKIVYDQYDIKKYVQNVGVNEIEFNTDEIIHFTLADIDGKVNGFTPVESVLVQLELLRFMWQNMMSMHKNGGAPDKLFILENTPVTSPAYKKMKEQLEKYKIVENKHGNLLFTGKVKVEDLIQLDTMQFKDMGLYITGLIAMQWGIPKSAIPYIIGGTNTKEDTGGNSEKSYWRVIQFYQQLFADTMNTQLWIPEFGVRIVFDDPFAMDDIQEQTALQSKLNNLKLLDEMVRSKGKEIKFEELAKLINMELEQFEDYEEPMLEEGISSTLNNQPSKNDLKDGDADKNVRAKKKREQTNLMAQGSGSTSGVGKEWDNDTELELKQLKNIEIKESNIQDVPFNMFIKLYQEDKVIRSGKPSRLFMRQNDTITSFKYMSDDFVYRTVVDSNLITDVNMMSLSGNLYLL